MSLTKIENLLLLILLNDTDIVRAGRYQSFQLEHELLLILKDLVSFVYAKEGFVHFAGKLYELAKLFVSELNSELLPTKNFNQLKNIILVNCSNNWICYW